MPPAPSTDAVRTQNSASAEVLARLRDYGSLTKPEISFLVTISAAAGFLLAPDPLDLFTLGITLVGVFLCAGGAGALNHYLEREIDAQMKRTRERPLPAGRVTPGAARAYGLALIAAGVALICPLVNPLTAILALISVALYLFAYTPLKRKTRYHTYVGIIPGALPALGGYAAATGTLGAGGWAVFALLAAWQIPHFLSLDWMYRHDYARGDFKVLPVVDPDSSGGSTARHMVLYTGVLLAVSALPTLLGLAGWLYLVGILPLGGWFLYAALRFYRHRTGENARYVLKASIYYIMLWTALILVDQLL